MRIVVANDEAFNFIYRANIDSLRQMGEVVFFSPLHDKALPQCDLLYLPGGYPELFLDELKANHDICRQIKDFAEQGGRILAECGGFMYLCRDIDGEEMCNVFPYSVTMKNARLHLGYREMNDMKGHEFHYSDIIGQPQGIAPTKMVKKYKNVIAGYTHWYWAEKGFETLWKRLSEE